MVTHASVRLARLALLTAGAAALGLVACDFDSPTPPEIQGESCHGLSVQRVGFGEGSHFDTLNVGDTVRFVAYGIVATPVGDRTVCQYNWWASRIVSALRWQSSNPKVATVDGEGFVQAVRRGTTEIWATDRYDTRNRGLRWVTVVHRDTVWPASP